MTADTLYCTCGREVRIVRLSREQLALGHAENPTFAHHPVRLAPGSDQFTSRVDERGPDECWPWPATLVAGIQSIRPTRSVRG